MNPIVVAYPRSGSEILTDIIFNYSRQIWDSERCLQEFLLVTFFRDYNFTFVDNKIQGSYWSLPKDQWPANWDKIKNKVYNIVQERISWLKSNPNYVFKLITTPRLTNIQYIWCIENYHCVFIERKDKIRSFLSFQFLPHIGTHHLLESPSIIKQDLTVKFNTELADIWIWDYKKYYELLKIAPNKSRLIYEDILDQGTISEEKILKNLGWNIPSNYEFYNSLTKPTPYDDDEILNYFENKNEVLEYIKKMSDIFGTNL